MHPLVKLILKPGKKKYQEISTLKKPFKFVSNLLLCAHGHTRKKVRAAQRFLFL